MDTLEIPVVEPERHQPPLRYRWSPHDRPPVTGRLFVGLIAVAAMLTTAALLLSDRAPGILRSLFGERARRLWARIDTGNRVDLPAGSDIVTQPDFLVHIALWTVVTVLVGLTIWTWRGLMFAVAALAVTAIGLELAQGRFATTRNVQASDALANLIGIAVGATLAGLCYLAWSGAAACARRIRRIRT
jgi:hypothetical protein